MEIDDLLGVPYRDRGRGPDGYDCWGLAIEAARRAGFVLGDIDYSDHRPELADENVPTLNVHPVDAPFEGAVLEMEASAGGRREIHIGICLNGKEFIHATRQGVRVNRIGSIRVKGIYGIDTRV